MVLHQKEKNFAPIRNNAIDIKSTATSINFTSVEVELSPTKLHVRLAKT